MNKKDFLKGYTERKMKAPGKPYWVSVLWTKSRTCRWTVQQVIQATLGRDSEMLQKHVVGTAGTPFCLKIQVFDQLDGVVYSISTEDFFRHGRESGPEFGCPLRHWSVERVNPEQTRMDFGVEPQRVEH